MGLDFLKILAEQIHMKALNSSPLKEEPGCGTLVYPLDLHSVSLLVSVVRKLEKYPGRAAKDLLGDRGVRFHAAQRARGPPDGAAPRARVLIMRFSFLFDDDDKMVSIDDQRCTGDSTAWCARAGTSAGARA